MSDDYESLRKENERLSAEISRLNYSVNRSLASLSNYDELLRKHCELLDRDLKDALDRVVNLELTVFPNLQSDINEVRSVIGEGENKSDNPLDRRNR